MRAFWVDRRDDRYETTVQHSLGAFDETLGDISPVRFAGLAWVLATPPALDPGFVRWHRRILTAMVGQILQAGRLQGTAAARPADLRSALPLAVHRARRSGPFLGQGEEAIEAASHVLGADPEHDPAHAGVRRSQGAPSRRVRSSV